MQICISKALVLLFQSFGINLGNDVCGSDKDKEIFTIEISRENDKNILQVVPIVHPMVTVKNGFYKTKSLKNLFQKRKLAT